MHLERVRTGIIGLDEILGGGRIPGEHILIVGPPGSGKSILSLSLLYKALGLEGNEEDYGIFLTADEQEDYLKNAVAHTDLFMSGLNDLLDDRLDIINFPPYSTIKEAPKNDPDLIEEIVGRLETRVKGVKPDDEAVILPRPRHVVIDGLTAMQSVLSHESERRRLTHAIIGLLSSPREEPEPDFGLCIFTAEASYGTTGGSYGERIAGSFDDYLFDVVIHLDTVEVASNRLHTFEVFKSRGRHSRDGKHTYSIVGEGGLAYLMQSEAARQEVRDYDTPILVYPRPKAPLSKEPRSDCEETDPSHRSTGIKELDELLDSDESRGLLTSSITAVVGGPATSFNTLALRYVVKGLEDDSAQPVLVVSFGRDKENFLRRGQSTTLLSLPQQILDENLHFLYYSPVGLNQNRLFYEIRKEVETYKIDRVVIHSVSNLPFAHGDPEASGEFLVPLINLLRELGCTAWITYVSDDSNRILDAPGRFVPSLADYVIVLRNDTQKGRIITKISVLKGHGANIVREEQEFLVSGGTISIRSLTENIANGEGQPLS